MFKIKFKVIHNDGTAIPPPMSKGKIMTNQCIWCSLKDYITTYLGLKIEVYELHKIGNLNHRFRHSKWDEDKSWANEALENVSIYFDLEINIYSGIIIDDQVCFDPIWMVDGNMISRKVVGDGRKNRVNIVHYDEHFDLITATC